jgi:hypothetical protein
MAKAYHLMRVVNTAVDDEVIGRILAGSQAPIAPVLTPMILKMDPADR